MAEVTSIHDANALLVFSVGPVLCCAPTLTVEAVIMPPHIHKTPGSDRNHPGVFRHSSGMVSVVDLRQRFGVEEETWQSPGRMIVTEIAGGHAGFMVDSIVDVMLWPEKGWGATPPLVPREVFKRTLMLKNQIHLYTDFEHLFQFRESGYLRAHIAALVEKQKKKTELVESDNTQHAFKLEQPQLLPELEQSAPPAQNNLQHVVPDNKAQEVRHRHKALPAKKNLQKKSHVPPSAKVKAELRPARVETRSPVTVENIEIKNVTSPPVIQPESQADSNTDRSGSLFIYGLFALILLAAALLVNSFNSAEDGDVTKRVDVVEPDGTAADIEYKSDVQEVYQANISEDDEGLVITIDEQSSDDIMPETTPVTKIEINNNIETPQTVLPPSAGENKVIVHIVKKGDTLWDIANHYVRDPWRYPELARLSSIKNPHRIYPGNKVKIIIRKVNKSRPK